MAAPKFIYSIPTESAFAVKSCDFTVSKRLANTPRALSLNRLLANLLKTPPDHQTLFSSWKSVWITGFRFKAVETKSTAKYGSTLSQVRSLARKSEIWRGKRRSRRIESARFLSFNFQTIWWTIWKRKSTSLSQLIIENKKLIWLGQSKKI